MQVNLGFLAFETDIFEPTFWSRKILYGEFKENLPKSSEKPHNKS